MRRFLTLASLIALTAAAHAIVVRPTPDVRWIDASGQTRSLSQFKGQPVVLLITPNARNRSFRSQLGRLRGISERLGAQKVIFLAAFTSEPGRVPSNIPFALAADGPKVGFDFGSDGRFQIAIIGADGNLDYVTSKVLPGQRIYDVIANSFARQREMRRP
jgi:hypothetical protein